MGDSREAPSSCLFVSDLPSDVTEKELERLFAGCHGFDSCRIRKDKNEHEVGFVEFGDPESASIAKDRFRGHELRGHSIAVCYARGRKRARPDRINGRESGHGRIPSGTSASAGYMGLSTVPGIGAVHSSQSYMRGTRLVPVSAMGLPVRLPTDAHHTLYVEGVPGDASEREMAHIFRPFPGYISLRVRAKGGRGGGLSGSSFGEGICFVEFESAYHATIAKMGVSEYRVDKSDRNTPILRVEYAKSKGGGGGRSAVVDRDRFK